MATRAPAASRKLFAFASIIFIFLAPLQLVFAQSLDFDPGSAAQVDFSQLTGEERAELLSRLSDEQVRELVLAYVSSPTAAQVEHTQFIDEINQAIALFRPRVRERLSHMAELPAAPGFLYAKLSEGRGPYHPFLVLGIFLVFVLIAFATERGYRRGAKRLYDALLLSESTDAHRRLGRLLARLGLDFVGLFVFVATLLGAFIVFYHGHEPTRLAVMTLLTALVIVRSVSAISRFFFAPFEPGLRVAPFDDDDALRIHRWTLGVASIAAFGYLSSALLLRLGLPPVQYELLVEMTGWVLLLTLIAGAIRLRKSVAAALVTQTTDDRFLHRPMDALASVWHIAFIAYILFLFLLSAYKRMIGEEVASYSGLVSLIIVILVPVTDFFLRSAFDAFFPVGEAEGSRKRAYALPMLKRVARLLVVILAIFLIGKDWGVNFFALGQESIGEELMRAVIDISLTLLAAYVAWGAIKASLARYLPGGEGDQAGSDGENAEGAASRLGTIMPLLMRFIQTAMATIVVMILLASLGVDIGPLLAGAGVIGVAVGFGAQSLVRDVVSGLFFLMDDAFRMGEYVDIGSVMGTVERINARSLVLRHHLGALHTVPYGEIQHLTNYSRDWVIVKMVFQVTMDTDVGKVKKIFKKIGKDLLAHPEFGPDFLEPFKSQGVKEIKDSAIILRGKFMSKPGRQFTLRKELFDRVHSAFRENGIEFANRNVTVHLPSNLKLSGAEARSLAESAAAAAVATEEPAKGS